MAGKAPKIYHFILLLLLMEIMEDTNVKRHRKKPNRYKSLMTRISTALSPSTDRKSDLKLKGRRPSSLVIDNSINNTPVIGEKSSIDHTNENEEPTYSDIQFFNQECTSSQSANQEYVSSQNASFSPPVPPKNLDEMYSKVVKNKKKLHNPSQSETSNAKALQSEDKREKGVNYKDMHEPAANSTSAQSSATHSNHPADVNHLKEQILLLQEELYAAVKENKDLIIQRQQFVEREKQWKKEIEKASMYRRDYLNKIQKNDELIHQMEKLEADTKKEVQALCMQVKNIKDEKNLLLEQLHSLHQENQSLYKMYDTVCQEKKSMVTRDLCKRINDDNQRQIDELNKKHEEELRKLKYKLTKRHEEELRKTEEKLNEEHKEEIEKLAAKLNNNEAEKHSLSVEIQLLQTDKKKLQSEINLLKNKNLEITKSKDVAIHHLEEMKQHEYEALNLLSSLLKVAEEVAIERDVMLKKSEFQDQQQKKFHSTVVEYSLDVGRIQEHVVNIRKNMNNEMQNIIISTEQKNLKYNNLKQMYEQQLTILREKIMQKSRDVDILNMEKRKLELDLENLLETICHASKKNTAKSVFL